MNNRLFIISGPSGAGEDTVIKGLKKHFKIIRVVTTVTREKRKGEKQGEPYYFISKEKFEDGIKKREFAEYADVYGFLYGTTFKELERVEKECEKNNKIGFWKIDWQGVKTVKKQLPNIISILIEPLSIKSLEKRLIKRGQDSLPVIQKRLVAAKIWLKHKDIYDYRVLNRDGKIDEAVEKIAKIINGI
ncbi:MAG: guanylate kinase [bacterium]